MMDDDRRDVFSETKKLEKDLIWSTREGPVKGVVLWLVILVI